jgi:hypothetical protein
VIVQTSAWPEPVANLPAQEQEVIFDRIAKEIEP